MSNFKALLSYTVLSLVATAYAAIGRVADLNSTNADISPDGFTRAAVVTNGVFPAPLITANKVSTVFLLTSQCFSCNVIRRAIHSS